MSKQKSSGLEVHVIPYHKPEGAKEYYVQVGDVKYAVWEFPFRYFKKLGGTSLKGIRGVVFFTSKLIILDSELKPVEKKWVLKHEIAHAMRHEDGTHMGEVTWDELETELLVLAEAEPNDYRHSTQKEVLNALKEYMQGGEEEPQTKARRLVEFLKEGSLNGQATKPGGIARLPSDSL